MMRTSAVAENTKTASEEQSRVGFKREQCQEGSQGWGAIRNMERTAIPGQTLATCFNSSGCTHAHDRMLNVIERGLCAASNVEQQLYRCTWQTVYVIARRSCT